MPALSAGFAAGVAVSQANVPNCSGASVASPGTVGAIVTQNATSTVVFPGQNNQGAGTTTAVEPSAGFLAATSTLTFTLPSGVLFSHAPGAVASGSTGTLAVPTGLTSSQFTGTPAVSPGVLADGTYYFAVSTKGATSGETMASAPIAVTVANAAATRARCRLSWTAVSGSIRRLLRLLFRHARGPVLPTHE